MKATWSRGLVLVVAAAGALEACSGSGVGFTEPGVAGSAHAGNAEAGAGNHAGKPASAGSAGKGGPSAGSGGDDTSNGGTSGASGAATVAGGGSVSAGAPGAGAPSGGAPQAGAPNGGAPGAGAPSGGAPGAGAPGAGAPNGGAPGAGAPGAGAPNGGGGNPSPVCGNSTLEAGEDCDDGNLTLLDGCSASCAFEQSQRSIWFKAQFATDAFCTANGFGSAFPAITRPILQQGLDMRIAAGTLNLLFAFVDLANPKAPNGSLFSLGVLYGSAVAGSNYNGASDLDWWYKPDPGTIDAQRKPVSLLAASVSGGVLTTSIGKIQLPLLSDVPLSLSKAQLRLPIGASSKPLTSAGGPPGHLAAEHLSASLTSVELGGAQTAAGAGELCGNISAASLKAEPIPPDFAAGGASPCVQGYTLDNTFLDVLVGGCNVGPGFTAALIATQPDQVDASIPNPGMGGPYKLVANAAHAIGSCRDKSNNVVALDACLSAAAYSTAYKLATDRVIIR